MFLALDAWLAATAAWRFSLIVNNGVNGSEPVALWQTVFFGVDSALWQPLFVGVAGARGALADLERAPLGHAVLSTISSAPELASLPIVKHPTRPYVETFVFYVSCLLACLPVCLLMLHACLLACLSSVNDTD